MYTSSELCKKIGITNHTLQSWMKRHSDKIKCETTKGGHRRFPIETVAKLMVVNLVRQAHWPMERALQIGQDLVNYDQTVYLNDTLLVLITKDSHTIALNGHKSLETVGTCINLTYPHMLLHIHENPPEMTVNERRERLGFEALLCV